jgi:hypothetical protein
MTPRQIPISIMRLLPSRMARDEWIACGILITVVALAASIAPLGLPYSDGLDIYYFKARVFFHDGSVLPYYTHLVEFQTSMLAHPPLVSLCVTWLGLFLGRIDEHATLLLWLAFLASLLALFYLLARSVVSHRLALWSTVGLALGSSPTVTRALSGSFTDLPFATIILAGCGLLWLWAKNQRDEQRQQGQRQLLLLARLALGAAALAKEEGMLVAALALAFSPLLVLWQSRITEPGKGRMVAHWRAPLL